MRIYFLWCPSLPCSAIFHMSHSSYIWIHLLIEPICLPSVSPYALITEKWGPIPGLLSVYPWFTVSLLSAPQLACRCFCTPAHLTFHPGGLSSRDLCPAAEGPPRSHPEASSLVVRTNVCLTKSELCISEHCGSHPGLLFVLLWLFLAPAEGFNHFYSLLHLEETAVRRKLEGMELVAALLASGKQHKEG